MKQYKYLAFIAVILLIISLAILFIVLSISGSRESNKINSDSEVPSYVLKDLEESLEKIKSQKSQMYDL